MKKRKPHNKYSSKKHHHIKLLALATSKLAIALFSFTIGLYLGSLTNNTFTALIIAVVFGALVYLLSVLHLIDWLEI